MGKIGAVIVAGGTGTRMGGTTSKQYLELGGKPVLVHTLELFQSIQEVETIVLTVKPGDEERCAHLLQQYNITNVHAIVPGGKERQHSVFAGLQALPDTMEWVMVHDAVRPFVAVKHIRACMDKAQETGAAVLAVRVKDTIKVVDETGRIEATPERQSLWAIQTPQAFRLSSLMAAHRQAELSGFTGTDDAMLMERAGHTVHVVEGSYNNIKLTTPDDLLWAGWFLDQAKKEGEQ
ncbi:2-C-methyl-D-erythritol 4-phosphate cytidylyltransferase [Paenibacillus senegalensis]|uniref:2-C-methyl-D-erythritol 4-phosphate cytidylyltransferase n=1 Tax=Paenibacillus senegalensis TaxID=1465766 RepID=UPI0002D970C8|nr:2-C-methyl-D-erythritol 4-phosphate cytidylyltransferase [Paenibacillus senegalensis]